MKFWINLTAIRTAPNTPQKKRLSPSFVAEPLNAHCGLNTGKDGIPPHFKFWR